MLRCTAATCARGGAVRGGVRLWEPPPRQDKAAGSLFGSSGARLHGKVGRVIDRRTLFVGSLNLTRARSSSPNRAGRPTRQFAGQLLGLFETHDQPGACLGDRMGRRAPAFAGAMPAAPATASPTPVSGRRAVRLAYWLPVDLLPERGSSAHPGRAFSAATSASVMTEKRYAATCLANPVRRAPGGDFTGAHQLAEGLRR